MTFADFIIYPKKFMCIQYTDSDGVEYKEVIEGNGVDTTNFMKKKEQIEREYDKYTMKCLFARNKYITSIKFVDKLDELYTTKETSTDE